MVHTHLFQIPDMSNYDPFLVGFDRLWNQMSQMSESTGFRSGGYPPYNIVKKDDYNYVIEMAVAGFGESDLNVVAKENILTVKGDLSDKSDDETYYRGIAGRSFDRSFTLADDLVVQDAKLENGMLRIMMERIVPEGKKPRTIAINGEGLEPKLEKELLTE